MLKKTLSALLIVFVMNFGLTSFASTNGGKEAKFAEKVKIEIAKLGTGEDAKIQVKLKGGKKLKGYVSEANNEQFVVADAETGQQIPVAYSSVKQVKGNNLSKEVIITVVVVGALIGFLVFLGKSLK